MARHPSGEGAEDRRVQGPPVVAGRTAVLSPQVCEPPQRSRRPSRHWSLSIEERRRRATLGVWEKRVAAGRSAHGLVRCGAGDAGSRGLSLPSPAPAPPLTLTSPAGRRADRGTAGVPGRGQGCTHPPPAEVLRVHPRLPRLPGPERAFLAELDFGGPGFELAALLRAHSAGVCLQHLSWRVLGEAAGRRDTLGHFHIPPRAMTSPQMRKLAQEHCLAVSSQNTHP